MIALLALAELAGSFGVNVLAAHIYKLLGELNYTARVRILYDLKKILKCPELKPFGIPSSKNKKPIIIAYIVSALYDDEKVSNYNENRNNLIEWLRVNRYAAEMAERFADALENAAKNYYSDRVDPGIREMTRQFNAKQSDTLKEIISNQENLRALIEACESDLRNTISNIYNITLNACTVNMQIGGTTNIFYYTEAKITGSRQIDFANYLKSILEEKPLSQIPNFYVETDVEHMKRTEIELWAQLVPEREEIPEDSANIEKYGEERNKEPVLSAIQRRKKEHLLLRGKPGSGKTTTLYRYMLILAEKALNDHANPIPVLVELKKQKSAIEIIRGFFIKYGLTLSVEEIESLLLSKKIFLLMDGLNEIPSDNDRKGLSDFIEDYGKDISIVFSSRVIGGMPGITFNNKFEMLPLTPKQVEEFVKKSLPVTDGELLRKIGTRIKKITDNPLLLRILCETYHSIKEIPGNLADLFDMFTKDYMKIFKGDPPVYCPVKDKWDDMLSRIAFKMIDGDGGTEFNLEMKISDAEDIIRDYISNNLTAPGIAYKASECLYDLIDHHLLTDAGDGKIGFFHQLIVEYYASLELENFIHDLPGEEIKRKYLNYQKWTEPFRLMLEMSKDQEKEFKLIQLSFDVDIFLSAYLTGSSKSLFNGKYIELLKPISDNKLLFIEILKHVGSESVLELLIALLKDKNSSVRDYVAFALGKIRSERALDALMTLLKNDDNNYVRATSALALGMIGSEEAIEPLKTTLKHENYFIRTCAAHALGEIGSDKAVEPLLAALTDIDPSVRHAIANALGEIGSKKVIKPLIVTIAKGRGVFNDYISILQKIGSEKSIEPLIATLKHEDDSVRRFAAEALGKIGSINEVEPLIALLKDKNSDVRQSVVEALGKIGSEKSVEPLIALLKDKNSDVRQSAFQALTRIGSVIDVEPLISLIKDEDSFDCYSAVNALDEIGSDKSIGLLMAILKDEDYRVRCYVAEALSEIGSENGAKPLTALLKDINSDVCQSAVNALGKIGSEKSVEPLTALLKDLNSDVCQSVVNALGKIGSEKSIEPLIATLKHYNDRVRRSAAEALGEISHEDAVEPLITLLIDKNSDVRQSAIRALGQIGSEKSIEPLIATLKVENNSVRRSVTVALGEIGSEDAVEPLIALLKDVNSFEFDSITTALQKIGSIRAIETLLSLVNEISPSLSASARNTLLKNGTLDLLKILKAIPVDTYRNAWSMIKLISSLQDKHKIYNPSLS